MTTQTASFPSHTLESVAEADCALSFDHVTKRFDGFAIDNVSFGVPTGSVVGLVGRNGAGKTTLMRAALGSVRLDEGGVWACGADMGALDDASLVRLRQRIAFVDAVLAAMPAASVAEVAQLYALAYPAFDHDAFVALCQRMELDAGVRRVSDLSRGTGMKLQLACALASGADLLLLDEPTAGLDPIVRDEVLDVLRAWMEGEGRSILISSHITSDLEHLADYLVMIEAGRVVLSCECDVIGETMGIARLRTDELTHVLEAWPFAATEPRVLSGGLQQSLLVPDREAFRKAFPGLACDRATIDEVMAFMAKGEVR